LIDLPLNLQYELIDGELRDRSPTGPDYLLKLFTQG